MVLKVMGEGGGEERSEGREGPGEGRGRATTEYCVMCSKRWW